MKNIRFLTIFFVCILVNSCALKPPIIHYTHGNIKDYRYIYISPTKTLTSSTGTTIYGTGYVSTTKSVNPSDVIVGILSKEGFIVVPELKTELAEETLIVNYGESGKRGTGLGSYTIEVTIQFISAKTHQLITSCTAEGKGETEADDIRDAITRCLSAVLSK